MATPSTTGTPPTPGPAWAADFAHAGEDRRAAGLLGTVYAHLRAGRYLPFGDWALPEAPRPPMDAVLGTMFPSTAMGRLVGFNERRRWYHNAYWAVMPPVQVSAHRAMLRTLADEQGKLRDLAATVASGSIATALHEAARRADDTARGYVPSAAAREAVKRTRPELRPGSTIERTLRKRLAPAIAAQRNPVLSQLFAHPHGVELVWAFSDSTTSGQQMAARLIGNAVAAAGELHGKLSGDQSLVWRFSPAIVTGVAWQRLADVPGFPQYAVQIARLRGRSTAERIINDVTMIVAVIGMATGPVGSAVAGIIDVGLSGANAALVYLREREQDLGFTATSFRPDEQRLAEPPAYLETALAGAAALISAGFLIKGPGRALLNKAGKGSKPLQLRLGPAVDLLPAEERVLAGPKGLSSVTGTGRGVEARGTARLGGALEHEASVGTRGLPSPARTEPSVPRSALTPAERDPAGRLSRDAAGRAEAVESTGASRSQRLTRVGAAAQDFPLAIKPRPNAELGLPKRAEREVRALVEQQGVVLPDYVDFAWVDNLEQKLIAQGRNPSKAVYGPHVRAEGEIFWDNPTSRDRSLITYQRGDDEGKLIVRLDRSLLLSDEDLVAHIAHEVYEIKQLETEFLLLEQERRKSMSAIQYGLYTNPRLPNMHDAAWDYAGEAVRHMRLGGPYKLPGRP